MLFILCFKHAADKNLNELKATDEQFSDDFRCNMESVFTIYTQVSGDISSYTKINKK